MRKKRRNTMFKGDDGGRLFFYKRKKILYRTFSLTKSLFLYRINL